MTRIALDFEVQKFELTPTLIETARTNARNRTSFEDDFTKCSVRFTPNRKSELSRQCTLARTGRQSSLFDEESPRSISSFS